MMYSMSRIVFEVDRNNSQLKIMQMSPTIAISHSSRLNRNALLINFAMSWNYFVSAVVKYHERCDPIAKVMLLAFVRRIIWVAENENPIPKSVIQECIINSEFQNIQIYWTHKNVTRILRMAYRINRIQIVQHVKQLRRNVTRF